MSVKKRTTKNNNAKQKFPSASDLLKGGEQHKEKDRNSLAYVGCDKRSYEGILRFCEIPVQLTKGSYNRLHQAQRIFVFALVGAQILKERGGEEFDRLFSKVPQGVRDTPIFRTLKVGMSEAQYRASFQRE